MSWDEEIDELVGSSLKMLRTDAGLTQGQLAERLAGRGFPMSQQTIAKIESGSRSLRFSEAVAIVQVLGKDARLEQLIYTSYEIGMEVEARRIADEIGSAIDRLSEASKDLTSWTLVGRSFLEENPEADGVAARQVDYFSRDGATGLFNVVKSGIREALEEGSYADEPTYRDVPEYAKPFVDVIEERDEPET